MSYTRIQNLIIDDESLSAHAKLVYMVICRFVNKKGQCWPSLKTIAAKASISERQVRYSLRELESKGYIKTETRSGKSSLFEIITPAQGAGVREEPRQEVPPPRQEVPGTPAQGADKQDLITISKNNKIVYTNEFLAFWETFPRKEGKSDAYRTWRRLLKEFTAEQLIEAAKRYANYCEKENIERKYIKKGVNFLKHRTFEDYLGGTELEEDPTKKTLARLYAQTKAYLRSECDAL